MMLTDPEKRKAWERLLLHQLNNRPGISSNYVLLTSEQLVGASIGILVKNEIVQNIRNVEVSMKKASRSISSSNGYA
jgi:hypothetical protein